MSTLPTPKSPGDVIRSADFDLIIAALNFFYPFVVSKTANYPATLTDSIILCDATSNTVDIELPVATNKGKIYFIVKTDGSGNAVTVTPNGGDTIFGGSPWTLNGQGNAILLVADGVTTWWPMASM